MTEPLAKAFEELKEEEALKKRKKKPALEIPKEKRLMYYSGWHEDDEPVDKSKIVGRQNELPILVDKNK
ncbi:hypothetical protein HYU13_05810 [Candidatus Woesearchaeota archaeon]|nr:hypothetical protein [Candidatus Woesearchaeota archaeon]